ncbi:MAG: hypothetical protein Q8O30_10805 [Candidatus Omnitrophota bacterium]|nr:hypothetical protein [Candidatus Omnitrophota bacterium]
MSSNKPVWFLNPWFDLILLTGLPFIFLTPLLNYPVVQVSNILSYSYVLLNIPHVASGFSAVYFSQKGKKNNPLIYIGMPFLILVTGMFLFFLKYTLILDAARFLVGMWHDFIQHHSILRCTKSLNEDIRKIDKRLDTAALLAGFSYMPVVYLNQFVSEKTIGKEMNSIVTHLIKYLIFLIWLIMLVFIARQIYIFFRRRELFLFKISLFIRTFFMYFILPFGIFKDINLSRDAQVLLHNKQYVSWVWLHFHKQPKDRPTKEYNIMQRLAQNKNIILYILLILAMSIGLFLLMKITHFFSIMAVILAYIHFFFEGIIWKKYRKSFGL